MDYLDHLEPSLDSGNNIVLSDYTVIQGAEITITGYGMTTDFTVPAVESGEYYIWAYNHAIDEYAVADVLTIG